MIKPIRVTPLDNYILLVEFDNCEKRLRKTYKIKNL